MTVFISHSFENKPEFENVADAMVQAGVPFWNPAEEVKSGDSLRDQLRHAVERCSVCVYVATHRAAKSSWCGAELGAFWGAGKRIIVYIADSSLPDDALPPIVQGDVWERKISRVVQRARELVDEAEANPGTVARPGSVPVGALTVEQLEKLIVGAVSLAAAAGKGAEQPVDPEGMGRAARGAAGRVLQGIQAAGRIAEGPADRWRKQILWVDDRPDNNRNERRAFESMGIDFTLAKSTAEALEILSKQNFAAIISDMGRKEGPREGYALLEAVRANDSRTPFFIYAGSNAPAHQREAAARGAQGTTNDPQELFDLVMAALPGASPRMSGG